MPFFDFPSSPTLNQTVTNGGVVYRWDGTKWVAAGGGSGGGTIAGDLLLARTDQPWAFVLRPNVPGFKNLSLAAVGDAPLDRIQLNSEQVAVSGDLFVTGETHVGEDLHLDRTDQPWAFVLRPNVAGYKNLALAADGDTPLDLVQLNALQVSTSGDLFVSGVPHASQANFTVISDIRVKRDIGPYDKGLQAILALRPIRYRYNGLAKTPQGDKERVGLDAAEAAVTMPELVTSQKARLHETDVTEVDLQAVDTGPLLFALVNAVRELTERIEALEKCDD